MSKFIPELETAMKSLSDTLQAYGSDTDFYELAEPDDTGFAVYLELPDGQPEHRKLYFTFFKTTESEAEESASEAAKPSDIDYGKALKLKLSREAMGLVLRLLEYCRKKAARQRPTFNRNRTWTHWHEEERLTYGQIKLRYKHETGKDVSIDTIRKGIARFKRGKG